VVVHDFEREYKLWSPKGSANGRQVAGVGFGIAAVAGWPTNTSVGTVFFGLALALIFTIPTGIIFATTGIEVEFNVLAEFIGGAWQPGNALAVSTNS
jgi:hypothetical protein